MAHIPHLLSLIQADESLPVLARYLFAAQAEEYQQLQARIGDVEVRLRAWNKAGTWQRYPELAPLARPC
jgi:transposase